MTRTPDFDSLLHTLTQISIRARLHWDIWWMYEGAHEDRPKLLAIFNRYSEFVRFDAHAHQTAHIIACYQLYERNKRTRNLSQLVGQAKGRFPPNVVAKAQALLDSAEPVAAKVKILRNNAFAHRSLQLGYDDAFNRVAVTAYQLRDLTDTALQIVNVFHDAGGNATSGFNDEAAATAKRLYRTSAIEPTGTR